jgi:hypothetical protein
VFRKPNAYYSAEDGAIGRVRGYSTCGQTGKEFVDIEWVLFACTQENGGYHQSDFKELK